MWKKNQAMYEQSQVNCANGQILTETKIWPFKTLADIPVVITPFTGGRGGEEGAIEKEDLWMVMMPWLSYI